MVKKSSKRMRSKLLTDQLRQAIHDSGLTRYRIAMQTGISESTLSQFYRGNRGLSMESLDRLFEFLGLRIVKDPAPAKRGE